MISITDIQEKIPDSHEPTIIRGTALFPRVSVHQALALHRHTTSEPDVHIELQSRAPFGEISFVVEHPSSSHSDSNVLYASKVSASFVTLQRRVFVLVQGFGSIKATDGDCGQSVLDGEHYLLLGLNGGRASATVSADGFFTKFVSDGQSVLREEWFAESSHSLQSMLDELRRPIAECCAPSLAQLRGDANAPEWLTAHYGALTSLQMTLPAFEAVGAALLFLEPKVNMNNLTIDRAHFDRAAAWFKDVPGETVGLVIRSIYRGADEILAIYETLCFAGDDEFDMSAACMAIKRQSMECFRWALLAHEQLPEIDALLNALDQKLSSMRGCFLPEDLPAIHCKHALVEPTAWWVPSLN